MLRATHIRTKLGLALAVPLLGLVVLAGFEVVAAVGAVDETRAETALAGASTHSATLVATLQDERHRAAVDLAGLSAAVELPVASADDARQAVDAAIAELEAAVQAHGGVAAGTHASALESLAGIEQLRSDVDRYLAEESATSVDLADEVFEQYSDLVATLHAASAASLVRMDDADLRAGLSVVHASSRQAEVRARMAWLGAVTTLDASRFGVAAQQVASLRDQGAQLDAEIRIAAIAHYEPLVGTLEPGPFDDEIITLLAGGTVRAEALLSGLSEPADTGYSGLRADAASFVAADAADGEASALARQWTFGGVALALFVLAPLVTWLAARSITRPLASLRRQAEDMAGEHLPAAVRQILDTPFGEDVVIPKLEPVSVSSHDEVAGVAAALSAVQTSALDLAVEQAVLRRNISDSYINLGRRNQSLLGRQLDFITELERNETDPDTLEGLFRLDHLATRMRRNAESLLVLAGVEPPRQWSAPVKAADVVRAALGEVEDYQRVVIQHLEPASLTGAVAADIAHLTAELLENALSFSPPEQPVDVKGRLTPDGYTIAISDNGFGMPPDELERANRRLAGAESFTVAPSRYLGHYVAGHLASRLGVSVELQSDAAGGITARVDVPMSLIVDDETDPHLNKLRGRGALDEPSDPAPAPAHLAAAAAEPAVEPVAEPVTVDPVTVAPEPASPPSVTAGGLPRRGERSPDPVPAPAAVEPPIVEPPAVEPAPTPEPIAPPAPSVSPGFGGLAVTPMGPSLFTVAARKARDERAAEAPAPGSLPHQSETTPTGLARRVPGAQRPDLPFEPVRIVDEPWDSGAPAASSADDVYSFLNSFQSGVDRGRTDALVDEVTDLQTPEDER